MGFVAFGILVVLCILIAAGICWAVDYLAPSHPAIVNKLVWACAVLIIVWALAGALGLHDVPIPRVFGR